MTPQMLNAAMTNDLRTMTMYPLSGIQAGRSAREGCGHPQWKRRIVARHLKTPWPRLKSSEEDVRGFQCDPTARTCALRVRRVPPGRAAPRAVVACRRPAAAGHWK